MSMTKAGAAALMALALLSPRSGTAPIAPDMDTTTGSVPLVAMGEARFSLHSGTGDDACLLTAADVPGTMDRRVLSFGSRCPDLGDSLNAARWWQDREDGSIAFMSDDGSVVAEFAVADGAAFVSYAPRQPIMTLLAVD